jgi:hypothetical protein
MVHLLIMVLMVALLVLPAESWRQQPYQAERYVNI